MILAEHTCADAASSRLSRQHPTKSTELQRWRTPILKGLVCLQGEQTLDTLNGVCVSSALGVLQMTCCNFALAGSPLSETPRSSQLTPLAGVHAASSKQLHFEVQSHARKTASLASPSHARWEH